MKNKTSIVKRAGRSLERMVRLQYRDNCLFIESPMPDLLRAVDCGVFGARDSVWPQGMDMTPANERVCVCVDFDRASASFGERLNLLFRSRKPFGIPASELLRVGASIAKTEILRLIAIPDRACDSKFAHALPPNDPSSATAPGTPVGEQKGQTK